MMKFFRKYNKHLLAVFMALLLVIWLGGSAIEEFVRPNPGKRVVGTAKGGPVTEAETDLAKREDSLLNWMGLSWQQLRNRIGLPEPTDSDERISQVDWVLLKREAMRLGCVVTPERARELLSGPSSQPGRPSLQEQIHMRAASNNIREQLVYDAAANYFTVWNALTTFISVSAPPEPELRLFARNVSEFATIEAVVFPAQSFADPTQTFDKATLEKQFESHKTQVADGGLNFGYFLQPRVKIQYICIDPQKIKDNLRASEKAYLKDAYSYWQANKNTGNEFRWTMGEIEAFKNKADADSNGAAVPKLGDYYETFAQAQEKALEAVKFNAAKTEADRIANRLLLAAREPWFTVSYDDTGHKPAPEAVKANDYYETLIASLPSNLQFPEGITVQTTDLLTQEELIDAVEGFSQAGLPTPDGGLLRPAQLAFNVQNIAPAPEERHRETALHLSLWQTLGKELEGMDGATYIFRVIDAQPGREAKSLDEVADKVADDLRLQAGMEKAKAAADAFLENIGTQGLAQAWMADEELKAKVTPDKGGYVEPPVFARDNSFFSPLGKAVQPFGIVTDEFIDKAFELAAEGEKSGLVVVELPDEAKVLVIKGKSLRPLYEEDYQARRDFMRQQFGRRQQAEIIGQWLNGKNIKERNGFKFKNQT
ncbi:MAG: hypothetical protein H6817_02230 [Phycisphaerales bacterium]|nr:hypothetical protein [Phycisphaerales bacterium]